MAEGQAATDNRSEEERERKSMYQEKLNEVKELLDKADQLITDLFDEDPERDPSIFGKEVASAFQDTTWIDFYNSFWPYDMMEEEE